MLTTIEGKCLIAMPSLPATLLASAVYASRAVLHHIIRVQVLTKGLSFKKGLSFEKGLRSVELATYVEGHR